VTDNSRKSLYKEKQEDFREIPVIVVTDVTNNNTMMPSPAADNTRGVQTGNKPEYPPQSCHICGSNNWWLRGNEWLCGKCHPDPQGECNI
jgi:hypothetical protein